MTDIFNNPSKPFYRFGDIMLLSKIETNKWVQFNCEGFKNTGKEIDVKTAQLIATLMKNHSWYVQQLAHYVWNITDKQASLNELNAALSELINSKVNTLSKRNRKP
ncbi:hypothetical protein [Breznakibacter xylanolyticus]|nr:hypothetical protein [Breznakibacter xylanolyticus]